MSFIKRDYKVTEDDALHGELVNTIGLISGKVAEKIGRDQSIRFPENDHAIAFAGSSEKPELLLTFEWQKCYGKPCICASLDDKYIWQEWDFGTRERLIAQIADFVAAKINGEK